MLGHGDAGLLAGAPMAGPPMPHVLSASPLLPGGPATTAGLLTGGALIVGALGLVTAVAVWRRWRARSDARTATQSEGADDVRAYRLLAEQASDLIARLDPTGRFRYASPSWEQLGWTPAQLRGRSTFDLVAEADQRELRTALSRVAGEDETGPLRYRLRSARGSEIWVETMVRGIVDPETGALSEIQLAARDVSARVAAEEALRSSQARYRMLVQGLREVVFETDLQGRWTFLSAPWAQLTGYGVPESLGRAATEFLDPADQDTHRDTFADFARSSQAVLAATVRIRRRDDQRRLVEVTARRQLGADGLTVGIVGTLDDRTETELARRERDRLAEILEATSDLVAMFDLEGHLRWINPAGARALGYRNERDLAGRPFGSLLPLGEDSGLLAEATKAADQGGVWSGELLLRRRDGTDVPFSKVIIAHRDRAGQIDRFSAIARDISQRKELEDQLSYLALRDPLTGLANRTLLLDRLGQALARNTRSGGATAVLFFDLDRFKLVNDSFGHSVGDELLQELATRIAGAIRPSDTAARFGGDEFVVVCEGLDQAEAVELAERIATEIARPVPAGGRLLELSTSIGLALAKAGDDPAKVIGDADAAMYRAKAEEPGTHLVFDETMRSDQQERLDLEAGLARVAERGELLVHYQPIVDIVSGRMHSVEALVRWNHPQRGIVSPNEFVSIAEESGAILSIGTWVLEEAARTVAGWRQTYPEAADLIVSVNLSGRQIASGALPMQVERILADTGLPPEALLLEITERVVVSDPRATIQTLETIRAQGVRFALDDFGTGHAPLTHLRQLPVDVVKVDRSFVVGLGTSTVDRAIVASLLELTNGLGLQLVAEGADSPRHVRELRRLGCRYVQGYHFSAPLPAAEAANLASSGWDPSWLDTGVLHA